LPPELNGLPPPVQRHLAVAMPHGARPIRGVTLEHTGTFNLSEDGERWRPFTSTQRTTLAPPGFDWRARIRLLPGPNLQWSPRDDTSARAELTAAGVSASLVFRFGADGLIESVRAEDRGRTVRGQTIPTPWEGCWTDYAERDGMRIPLSGEVAWLLPGRRHSYWRGQVQRVEYQHD
jgi:hypothetical protein